MEEDDLMSLEVLFIAIDDEGLGIRCLGWRWSVICEVARGFYCLDLGRICCCFL